MQDPAHRWYEPLKDYFTTYSAYANGQLYVLSYEAMQWIVPLAKSLRVFVHDGMIVALFLLRCIVYKKNQPHRRWPWRVDAGFQCNIFG